MSDQEKWLEHPTFGLVQFSRITGETDLVGSGVTHQHFMSLSIQRAKMSTSYGEATYFPKDQIVEAWMSAAQFSELITTMNIGLGVPCTLKRVNKEMQGAVPKINTRLKMAEDYAKSRHAEFAERVKHYSDQAAEILNKEGAINKSDRKDLLKMFEMCFQEIAQNMPWYAKVFEEVKEKVVSSAKTEVESFIALKVAQLGVKSLGQMQIEGVNDGDKSS